MASKTVWIKEKTYKEIEKLVNQTHKSFSSVINDLLDLAFNNLNTEIKKRIK